MSEKDINISDENIEQAENAEAMTREDIVLPQNTVLCFPANKKQVISRRVLTGIFGSLSIAGLVFFLLPETQNFALGALVFVILIVCLLVFIQTFLIESFRVALDYNQNKVVLRYMFRKLSIDFEKFDAKEGVPDKTEQMIRQHTAGTERQNRMYLILDDVYADACYQTTSADLASLEDFLKLKEEAFNIARVYKAKENYDALKNALDPETQTEYQSMVAEAMDETRSDDIKDDIKDEYSE